MTTVTQTYNVDEYILAPRKLTKDMLRAPWDHTPLALEPDEVAEVWVSITDMIPADLPGVQTHSGQPFAWASWMGGTKKEDQTFANCGICAYEPLPHPLRTALYTHADPAEVEQLRQRVKELESKEQGCKVAIKSFEMHMQLAAQPRAPIGPQWECPADWIKAIKQLISEETCLQIQMALQIDLDEALEELQPRAPISDALPELPGYALAQMKLAREALQRVDAGLSVLTENKNPLIGSSIAAAALYVDGDMEICKSAINSAIAASQDAK